MISCSSSLYLRTWKYLILYLKYISGSFLIHRKQFRGKLQIKLNETDAFLVSFPISQRKKTVHLPYHTNFLTKDWEISTTLPVWLHYHFLNHSLGQSRHKRWTVNHYKSSCWHVKNLSYWSKEPIVVLAFQLLHFLNVDINFTYI